MFNLSLNRNKMANEMAKQYASLIDKSHKVDIEFVCSENSDICGLSNDRIIISERETGARILDTFNEWYLSSNVIKENM